MLVLLVHFENANSIIAMPICELCATLRLRHRKRFEIFAQTHSGT